MFWKLGKFVLGAYIFLWVLALLVGAVVYGIGHEEDGIAVIALGFHLLVGVPLELILRGFSAGMARARQNFASEQDFFNALSWLALLVVGVIVAMYQLNKARKKKEKPKRKYWEE